MGPTALRRCLPLYWGGNGSQTGINYYQSVGNLPVLEPRQDSHHHHEANFKWSTGAPVTSNDDKFYFDLLNAVKKTLGNYLPRAHARQRRERQRPQRPDVRLAPEALLQPDLVQREPVDLDLPASGPGVGKDVSSIASGLGCLNASGGEAGRHIPLLAVKEAERVRHEPAVQDRRRPFEISSYNVATHAATFVANPNCTGPTKPRIAGYKVFSFTTGTVELNALRSGDIAFGYIPFGDLKQSSYLKSHSYSTKWWPVFYNQVVELGYTSKKGASTISPGATRPNCRQSRRPLRFGRLANSGPASPRPAHGHP